MYPFTPTTSFFRVRINSSLINSMNNACISTHSQSKRTLYSTKLQKRLVYKKSFIQKNILAPRIKNIQVRIYILFVTIQYIYN